MPSGGIEPLSFFSSHLKVFFSKHISRIYFPLYVNMLGRRKSENYIFLKGYFFLVNDQGVRSKPPLIQKANTNPFYFCSPSKGFLPWEKWRLATNKREGGKYNRFNNQAWRWVNYRSHLEKTMQKWSCEPEFFPQVVTNSHWSNLFLFPYPCSSS